MKTLSTAIITLFLSICVRGLEAQTTQTKLNQVELIKQFTGSWKGEAGKDTTAFWDIKSSGTGIECNFSYVTKGNLIMEGNQLWSYDNKVDKFILSSTTNGMESGTLRLWFTSKNKCLITAFSNISNAENASFKLETEFKAPDMFVQKTIVNNIIIKTGTYNRVKK